MSNFGQIPGSSAIIQTDESIVWSGRQEQLNFGSNLLLDSTAVDAGNTPTTTLRAGLLLGKKTSDNNLYAWDPDGTDGTEIIEAILLRPISMLNKNTGVVEDKLPFTLISGGILKTASLLIQGTAFTSSTAEWLARRQLTMGGRFLLDDDLASKSAFLGGALRNKAVAGDTTLTAADNGTRFVAITADADFTLPTIEAGLVFEFLRASDHEMAIISPASNMIVGNDLTADSVTFTTAGEQIGAQVRVESIYVGTTLHWLVSQPTTPFGTNSGTGFTMAIGT